VLVELQELKQSIIENRVNDALTLVEELDGMSRKAITRTIRSYLVRLLVHLIKNQVEQRLTNSWAASIRGSIMEIYDLNLQDNKKTYYLKPDDWAEYFEIAFENALYESAAEIFGGKFTAREIATKIDKDEVKTIALLMLKSTYTRSVSELSVQINYHLGQLPGGELWRN
jgi:hypothetical protein